MKMLWRTASLGVVDGLTCFWRMVFGSFWVCSRVCLGAVLACRECDGYGKVNAGKEVVAMTRASHDFVEGCANYSLFQPNRGRPWCGPAVLTSPRELTITSWRGVYELVWTVISEDECRIGSGWRVVCWTHPSFALQGLLMLTKTTLPGHRFQVHVGLSCLCGTDRIVQLRT